MATAAHSFKSSMEKLFNRDLSVARINQTRPCILYMQMFLMYKTGVREGLHQRLRKKNKKMICWLCFVCLLPSARPFLELSAENSCRPKWHWWDWRQRTETMKTCAVKTERLLWLCLKDALKAGHRILKLRLCGGSGRHNLGKLCLCRFNVN